MSLQAWSERGRGYTRGVPVSREALLYYVDYCAWANQELLHACSGLSSEELNRDLKMSHSSVLAVLRHIFYAERVWLKRLREGAMPPLVEVGDQRLFGDAPPEPDLEVLRQRWPEVARGLREYVSEMPVHDIDAELAGPDCGIARWKLVFHMVNHSTLHRGQVVSALRMLGHQPPNVDVFSFHLQRG